jgi:hypothetical protein
VRDETTSDEVLADYVLGRLDEGGTERVEERLFADRDLSDRLLAVEDDLVDAYACGRLTGDDRVRFEERLLRTREDRERVAFASALASRSAGKSSPKRGAVVGFPARLREPSFLLPLVATLLLTAGVVALVARSARLSDRLDRLQAEKAVQEERAHALERQLAEDRGREQEMAGQIAEERRRSQELLEALERERARRETERGAASPPEAASTAAFILLPGMARSGGGASELSVPPGTERLRLTAVFRVGDYRSYRAEIQTVDGRVIWSRAGLRARRRPDGSSLTVTVPASALRGGDYILNLSGATPAGGVETVEEYYFRFVAVDR